MSYLIEGGVPIADIAKVLKRTVAQIKADCERLGLGPLGTDWRGQPAVTQREAHELVTGRLTETVERERAWHQYREAAEAWARARDTAFAEGSKRTDSLVGVEPIRERERRDLVELGREAAREFEQNNPVPTWTDGSMPLAQPRYIEQGMFRRALDRLGVA